MCAYLEKTSGCIDSDHGKNSGGVADAWLDDSLLFTPWCDPVSGITSYILKPKVAPFQQSFYYINQSLTREGRYYWFYCAYPPAPGKTLAVVDLHKGEVHHFPETQFQEASPCVDEETGVAYWANDRGIWSIGPVPGGKPRLVNRFSPEFQGNRTIFRYATHLTFSADRTALAIDAEVGNDLYIGHAPLNGDPIVTWQKTILGFNHAQFSPVDNDLQMVAQDNYVDRSNWKLKFYENRLWFIRKGEVLQPFYPEKPEGNYHAVLHSGHQLADECRVVDDARNMHGHEWWGRDGRHIWYLHYEKGVERLALGSSRPELIWPHNLLSHAHSDLHERYLVADVVPPNDPVNRHVLFRNIGTGEVTPIVSHMPEVVGILQRYHVHPHPQFCLGDSLICYTTTVFGSVDVAFARVADLIA
ncbi:MAG: hypothetical protein WC205_15375 [Opitutaceae bacterium]|jgi:hypothetical protein